MLLSVITPGDPKIADCITTWPTDFFEATASCLANDRINRELQGEYEHREPLT
jgi:hypothetical protein